MSPNLPPDLARQPEEPAGDYLRRLNTALRMALRTAQACAAQIDTLTAATLSDGDGLRGKERLAWWAQHEMSPDRGYSVHEVAAAAGVPFEGTRKYVTTLERRGLIVRDFGADASRLACYHPTYKPQEPEEWARAQVLKFLSERPGDRFNPAALAVYISGGYTSRTLGVILGDMAGAGLIRYNLRELGTDDYSALSVAP